MRRPTWCGAKLFLGLTILSLIVLIVGLVLTYAVFPNIIDDEIEKSVRLDNHTEQYDRFLELPFPITFKVYLFQVTNEDGIMNGETPELEEIGPYVYKQYRNKTEQFHDDQKDTVSFTQKLGFEFDEKESAPLTENDVVTVLNPPYNSMLQIADKSNQAGLLYPCLTQFFPNYDGLFITIPVKKLLFEGLIFFDGEVDWRCIIQRALAYPETSKKRNIDILDDGKLKFSFFNYKMSKPDGLYTVNRGIEDISKLGHIQALNNMKYTKYWSTDNSTCDEVKGTDSTLYPPHVEDTSVFQIFSTDICRSVEIYYQKEDTYKGIKGLQFGPSKNTLRSKTAKLEDDCFCSKNTSGLDGQGSCFLDGVIDLMPCVGVPVLLSFPHFLDADESYLQGVKNLNPDREKHQIFLLVEPNTGTPLHGSKKIQMNMVIRPLGNIPELAKIKPTVLPMFWIEEGVALTDKYIDELNDKFFNKKNIINIFQWTLVGIGSVFTLIFGIVFIRIQFF